jgi:hypothetical protein
MDQARQHKIRSVLRQLAKEVGAEDIVRAEPECGPDGLTDPNARRVITAKAWQRASDVRRQIFAQGTDLFADPAWEILLDLFIEEAEGRPVTVTSACIAAKVPQTTGLRWLERLVKSGLIERMPDRTDGRRVYVTLASDCVAKIAAALDLAVESDRKLGLGRLEMLH